MTEKELKKVFEENDKEYLKFEKIPNDKRFSNRPDLHAFICLSKLIPDTREIVSGAEHDEIFLSITLEKLASVITVEEAIDLIRCGIRVDTDTYGLAMFV
jgi:hypothetical protein